MSLDRELNFLLSTEYDPATQSLFKFRQAYNRIAEHRDRLCWEINRKKQRRVDIRQAESYGTTSGGKGSRFNSLPDIDDGSAISSPATYTFPASLTAAQLEQLTSEGRKTEIAKIQRDIQLLEEEKKEKKKQSSTATAAAAAASKNDSIVEESRKKKDRDEAQGVDRDVASDSELGQGWKKVERRSK